MKTLKEYGYKSEKDFIKDAAIDQEKRDQFKEFMKPLVLRMAQLYVEKCSLDKKERKKLVIVGMSVFDEAFNNYIQKVNMFDNKGSYRFTTYFAYWIKYALEIYLNIDEELSETKEKK